MRGQWGLFIILLEGLTYIVVPKFAVKDPLSPICVTEGPDASLYGLGIPGVPKAPCTVAL